MGLLTEVGWTIGDGTANVVGDTHGQVEPVDETDVVPIESTGVAECPFSHRCRGHTRARTGVAFQSAVAACRPALGQWTIFTGPGGCSFSPPVRQELGPGFWAKLQPRRPQMRPDRQLSGTLNVFSLCGGAVHGAVRCCGGLVGGRECVPSQPRATSGTAVPTLRSVKTAGLNVRVRTRTRRMVEGETYQTVKEQEFLTVNCRGGQRGQVGWRLGARCGLLVSQRRAKQTRG